LQKFSDISVQKLATNLALLLQAFLLLLPDFTYGFVNLEDFCWPENVLNEQHKEAISHHKAENAVHYVYLPYVCGFFLRA